MSSIYDSNDFDECILAHMLRSPEIFNKTKRLRMTGDDFMSSAIAGIRLYKEIADLCLRLDIVPLPKNILELELNVLVESGLLSGVDPSEMRNLIDWFYTTELSDEYVDAHLDAFIRHRRFSKAQQLSTDPVSLFDQLHLLDKDIPKSDGAVISDPFQSLVFCRPNLGISTGFQALDISLGGGTHKEECGLIMAASGSGKTTLGVNFAVGGMGGYNTLYLSLEEPYEHLTQRFYARLFEVPYTPLKNGDAAAQATLIDKFNTMTKLEKEMFSRLKIVDGRSLCPINYKTIQEVLERAADEGFLTDVLIIDQLDFMTPYKSVGKSADKWREYEQTSFEVDDLSNYKIGGSHTIGVWLLHQLRGKPQWVYSYDDVAGFKGIVKPFDTAIAAGRVSGDPKVNLHSLKTRHGEPFAHVYEAEFQFMKFKEATDQNKPEEKDNEVKRKGKAENKPQKMTMGEPAYTGPRIDAGSIGHPN